MPVQLGSCGVWRRPAASVQVHWPCQPPSTSRTREARDLCVHCLWLEVLQDGPLTTPAQTFLSLSLPFQAPAVPPLEMPAGGVSPSLCACNNMMLREVTSANC